MTIQQKRIFNLLFFVIALVAVSVIGRNVLSHRHTPETLVKVIKSGDVKQLHEMLKDGADPNGKDGSPMQAALNQGNYKKPELSLQDSARRVTELIRAGARFNLEICLTLANRLEDQTLRRQIATFFYDAINTGESQMTTLARIGDVAMFNEIIGHGGSVNQASRTGTTPLIAAAGGSPEMVKTVMKYHPSINATDKEGDTALIKATSLNRPENVRLLLELGADATLKNQKGETAFTIAKAKHSPQLDAVLKNVGTKFSRLP